MGESEAQLSLQADAPSIGLTFPRLQAGFGLELVEYAVDFGDAPGLGPAAALGMGCVAVEDFGQVADAAGFEEGDAACE